jgi:hypothetical protein
MPDVSSTGSMHKPTDRHADRRTAINPRTVKKNGHSKVSRSTLKFLAARRIQRGWTSLVLSAAMMIFLPVDGFADLPCRALVTGYIRDGLRRQSTSGDRGYDRRRSGRCLRAQNNGETDEMGRHGIGSARRNCRWWKPLRQEDRGLAKKSARTRRPIKKVAGISADPRH